MAQKDKWLRGIQNGTGQPAPTWKGHNPTLTGDYNIKRTLLDNLRKQQGLPSNHSFVTGA